MNDWRPTKLGDEIGLAYGKSLPSQVREPGPFNVYGSNGIVGVHSDALLPGPGIVVGRKGSVGEVVFSAAPFWPIDTTYFVVNKNGHDWRFLYHLLRVQRLGELNSHSAVPGLNREDVYSIAAAFPPPAEQKLIGAVLDTAEDSIAQELRALAEAATLKRITMRELFTRGLRDEPQKESEIGLLPGSWETYTVGRNFSVVSGGTPSRANAEYWKGGDIPWVKTTEVNYGVIETTDEKITVAGLENSSAKLLPVGTLLLAMYGQGVTRGRVALLGIKAACNQACAAIQARDGTVSPRYLFHFLTYRYEQIRQMAHGGQQQNLNLEIVRDLPLAFPKNSEEQKEIVQILDALDTKIDLHKRKRAVLEDLFKALLHRLITGEIRVADLDLSALSQKSLEGVAA